MRSSPGFWRRENRGARAAIFKSTDGAQNWTRITNGLADDLDSMVADLIAKRLIEIDESRARAQLREALEHLRE